MYKLKIPIVALVIDAGRFDASNYTTIPGPGPWIIDQACMNVLNSGGSTPESAFWQVLKDGVKVYQWGSDLCVPNGNDSMVILQRGVAPKGMVSTDYYMGMPDVIVEEGDQVRALGSHCGVGCTWTPPLDQNPCN